MLKVVLFLYKWKLAYIFFVSILIVAIDSIEPLLLKLVLVYFESDNMDDIRTMTLFYTIGMLTSLLVEKLLKEHLKFYKLKSKVQVRQAINAVIYSKVLKVSPSSNRSFDKGRIINMSQSDVDCVTEALVSFPEEINLPFKICFLMISLYMLIGNLVIMIVGVMICFILINYLLARLLAIVQKAKLKALDTRLHKLNEAIENIKILKLNLWIEKYREIINKARNSELIAILQKSLILSASDSINSLNYPIMAIMIFSVAIFGIKMPISVSTAMAIKHLLKKFKSTIKSSTKLLGDIVELLISINRVQNFLDCEEANLSVIKHSNSNYAISINRSSFFWGFDQQSDKVDKDLHKIESTKFNSNTPSQSK